MLATAQTLVSQDQTLDAVALPHIELRVRDRELGIATLVSTSVV